MVMKTVLAVHSMPGQSMQRPLETISFERS
jgi:hypothetical protein